MSALHERRALLLLLLNYRKKNDACGTGAGSAGGEASSGPCRASGNARAAAIAAGSGVPSPDTNCAQSTSATRQHSGLCVVRVRVRVRGTVGMLGEHTMNSLWWRAAASRMKNANFRLKPRRRQRPAIALHTRICAERPKPSTNQLLLLLLLFTTPLIVNYYNNNQSGIGGAPRTLSWVEHSDDSAWACINSSKACTLRPNQAWYPRVATKKSSGQSVNARQQRTRETRSTIRSMVRGVCVPASLREASSSSVTAWDLA